MSRATPFARRATLSGDALPNPHKKDTAIYVTESFVPSLRGRIRGTGGKSRPIKKMSVDRRRMQLLDDRAAKRLAQLCSMRVEQQFDTVLIRLHGEFDVTCEEPFREELAHALEEETTILVLDLRALTFMDSTGLRMLVTLNGANSEDGLDFTVLCGEGNVRQVLRETGLDGVLRVVDPSGAVPASDSPV
jgi:anti-sigma B factor antagonist